MHIKKIYVTKLRKLPDQYMNARSDKIWKFWRCTGYYCTKVLNN